MKLTFSILVDDVFEKMDDNLKTWHDGRGYFLQRFEANVSALMLGPQANHGVPHIALNLSRFWGENYGDGERFLATRTSRPTL